MGVKILLLQVPENGSMQSTLGTVIPSSASSTLEDVRVIGWIVVDECYQYRDWEHWNDERERHQVSTDSKFEMTADESIPRWVRMIINMHSN
jgi:hypothetical protein